MSRTISYPPSSHLDLLVRARPTLVVFLRHFGCTFCREALADVAAARTAIEATGIGVVFVHGVAPAEADPWFARAGLGDVPRVSDPALSHYRAFGLETANVGSLVSPVVWARGAVSAARHGFGGQPLTLMRQLPGVFVVQGTDVLAEYRHRSPSDRPDYLALIERARGVTMR